MINVQSTNLVLTGNNICKNFQDGGEFLTVLDDIDFKLYAGQHVAIVGPSGSGKSTLLQILAGLLHPTSGEVLLDGFLLSRMNENELTGIRNKKLGFIYQFHHLLAEFTALENVMIPQILAGTAIHQAKIKALELLDDVGLTGRVLHKPHALSGGERQRVAIARALVNNPLCVLADEPTGNLDTLHAKMVFELMKRLTMKYATAFVIVTHDLGLAAKMDLICSLKNGKMESV